MVLYVVFYAGMKISNVEKTMTSAWKDVLRSRVLHALLSCHRTPLFTNEGLVLHSHHIFQAAA